MWHDIQANTCFGYDFPFLLHGTSFANLRHSFKIAEIARERKVKCSKESPSTSLENLPLDTLIAKMPHSIIPEDQRVPYVDSDASEYEWQYESSEDDAVRAVPPTFTPFVDFLFLVWLDRKVSPRS